MVRDVALSRVRFSARAPRRVFVAACAVVAVSSAAGLARSDDRPVAPVVREMEARSADAEGLAELFVRTYFGEADPDARAEELTALGYPATPADTMSPDGSVEPVLDTIVVRSVSTEPGGWSITVAARRRTGTTFVRVPVTRTKDGLGVQGPPALVSPPPTRRASVREPEVEVEDRALRAAAARVVRHYLAGRRDELSADLAAGVEPDAPATSFRVLRVVATTWVRPSRRVATEVLARSRSGQQLTLRYELPVVRVSGRWLVTGVDPNTPDREVTR